MKRSLWFFIILILPLLSPGYSLARSVKPALLKDIDVVTSIDDTRIKLQFTGPPHENGITYQKDFLQIEFSNTYIDPPKKWIEINDETVKNIFVYQFNPDIVRARLFTIKRPEDLIDNIKLSREDNKVIISYSILARDDKNGEAKASPTYNSSLLQNRDNFSTRGEGDFRRPLSGEGIIPVSSDASTENKAGGTETLLPNQVPEEKHKEGVPIVGEFGSPDVYSSFFRMILALGIVLALLFISLFIFKRFLGRKMGIKGQNQEIRVITNAYIGSKKSIALVEVSGEKIVVGVTPNHITMLARLGKYDEFKDILKEQISSNGKVELQDDLWEKV